MKIIFKNIGGGCFIRTLTREEFMFSCDAHYKSNTGIEFKLKTSPTGYRYLPESFEVEEMSEIKSREQQAITEAKLENIKI